MTAPAMPEPSVAKVLYRVTDAMEVLSLSRTVVYELIRSGRLRTVTVGRSRRITHRAITDYVTRLEDESPVGRERR